MAFGDTNINIEYTNFCRGPRLGVFSYINTDDDTLRLINDTGGQITSYNLDSSLEGTLIGFDYAGPIDLSADYDGLPFFTLERISSTSCKIKRWEIDTNDNTLDLKNTITKNTSGADYYDALAGAIEYYRRSFGFSTTSGVNMIQINNGSRISSGMRLYLGPSTDTDNVGAVEWVTVNYRSGTNVFLTSNIQYEYANGDPITTYKNYYVISSLGYAGDTSKGTIFKLDANSGTKIETDNSGKYKKINAAKWSPSVDGVAAVNKYNMLFIRPYTFYQIWKSALMNNIEDNFDTIIPVEDIAFYDDLSTTTIYKLMHKVTGRSDTGEWTTYDWANYNFHADNLSSYANSIDISTDKQVLIGASVVTTIRVKVIDQFGVGLINRNVVVSKEGGDPAGAFDPPDGILLTDANGEASIQYTSGTNYNNYTTITARSDGGDAAVNGSQYVWNSLEVLSRIDADGQVNAAEYNCRIQCFGDNPKIALSTLNSDGEELEVNARVIRQINNEISINRSIFCKTFFTSPGGDWYNLSKYAGQAKDYLPFLVLGEDDGPRMGFLSDWVLEQSKIGGYKHVNAIKQTKEFEAEGYARQLGNVYDVDTVTSGVYIGTVTISGAEQTYSNLIKQLEDPESYLQISQLNGSYHTFWVEGVAYDRLFTRIGLNQFIFVVDAIPAFFSSKNPVNTDIWIRIKPYSYSLNASSLVFRVREVSYDGDTGYIDVTSSCVVTTFDAGGGLIGLDILYDPPVNFHHDARVYVQLEIYDTAPSPNFIYTYYWFDIVPDLIFPYLENLDPDRNETYVDEESSIYFEIKDDGSGIDIDTLELYVDNRQVTPTSINRISRTHYTVEYDPPYYFQNDKEIQVGVIVSDIIGNTLNTSYRFYTIASDPPWFIPISPRICQHDMPRFQDIELLALTGDDGLDLETIRVQLHGIDVTDGTRFLPVLYRQGEENSNIGPSLTISDLSLGAGQYTSSSNSIYVDITDSIFDVTTSGCYFELNGTAVSGTTLSGITNGYRMFYDPVDNFESFNGINILTAYAESGSTTSGIYTKQQNLSSDFYLTYGYHTKYDNSRAAGIDLGYDQKVVVRVSAENDVSCPNSDAFAYWFKTNTNLPINLAATIVGLTEGGYFRGDKDLSAQIYPQSTAFQYGKEFTVVVTAKDYSGNEMPPYVLTFKIEDKPE